MVRSHLPSLDRYVCTLARGLSVIIALCFSPIPNRISLLQNSSMAATHTIKISNPNPICLLPTSSPPPPSPKLPNNNVSHFFGATLSRISSYESSAPTLSRRLVLTSVAGLWDALTSGGSAREAVAALRRGMLLFRQVELQTLNLIFPLSLLLWMLSCLLCEG